VDPQGALLLAPYQQVSARADAKSLSPRDSRWYLTLQNVALWMNEPLQFHLRVRHTWATHLSMAVVYVNAAGLNHAAATAAVQSLSRGHVCRCHVMRAWPALRRCCSLASSQGRSAQGTASAQRHLQPSSGQPGWAMPQQLATHPASAPMTRWTAART
jgi:hypothetical protein